MTSRAGSEGPAVAPQLGLGPDFFAPPAPTPRGAKPAPASAPKAKAAEPAAKAAEPAARAAEPADAAGAAEEPALGAELEAALLRQLRQEYDWENHARFRNRLKAAIIALSDDRSHWGRWVGATRTLELSRRLVLGHPWPQVIGVMLHEMAHQYVDEVLRANEASHGPVFQRVCAERGIDAKAAGAPTAARGATAEMDRVLDRIRKLLALAGSSNQHEAETAMRKAHELMLRHNIETVRGREHAAYEVDHLGDPTKRGNRVEDGVMALLAEYFFVKVIRIPVYLPRLGRRGQVFEISGTHANLEMAKHVYHFLLATAERLWQDNRHDTRVASGRDRLAYQAGVITGFFDKLRDERKDLKATGLVWVGDSQLDAFYHLRHPRIVTRRSSVRRSSAHEAGREAGRTIVLHRPVTQGSSGGGPKLLR